MSNPDLDDLAAELAEFAPPEKKSGRSAIEERVIAGFEEIQRFVDKHGRLPQHGEDRDIFERLYAVRLDRLRALVEWHALLKPLDHQGLLAGTPAAEDSGGEAIDIDKLASELADVAGDNDITVLRHVRPSAEKRAAEEIADRKPCEDFDTFKPLFYQVRNDLSLGIRVTRPFGQYATIEVGHWFILDGQIVYVAAEGEEFDSPQGKKDARLRVIFLMGQKATSCGYPWRVLCTRTKPLAGLRIPTWGHCSAMRLKRVTWKAAPFMYCARSRIIPLLENIGTSFTRLG